MRRIGLALLAATMVVSTVMPASAAAAGVTRAGADAMCRGVVATLTGDAGSEGALIVGTDGPDVIVGTPGPDRIDARDGDDLLCALGGDDLILGSGGNDRIYAGGGHDEVAGGAGRDVIRGEQGEDQVEGDDGRDRIMGGGGDDVLDAGNGSDQLRGDAGFDRCDAGAGRAIGCEAGLSGDDAPDVGAEGGNGEEIVDGAPADAPPVPVLPEGLELRVVGDCIRVDSPSYPGEDPWYSGASFCTIEMSSTQMAPRLAGSDENVTVGFLCNSLNAPITELKNPFACLMSRDSGAGGIGGTHDLGPRDRPGPVSGRFDFVRTGESYCAHVGSVVYFNEGRSWLPNMNVVGTDCFTLTAAGRIVWS